jgi:radical SAM protein with 4Fe4S-binding SPASM domain
MEEEKKDYTYAERDKFVKLVGEEDYHETIARVKGEPFREYRRMWDAAGRMELETQVPLHVDIELSTNCNLRCPMCPFGMPKAERPANFDQGNLRFSFEVFKKVVDEGVPLGLKALDISYFNEPLLRKDFLQFIHYAHDHGVIDIMLSTNGQLLTAEVAEKLLDSPITRVMISLDAFKKETYDQIRIGGEFHRVMKNVEHFLDLKKKRGQVLPITRVSFVKTNLNEAELAEFIAHWKPRVDYMSIQELIQFDAMKDKLVAKSRAKNLDFHCHQPWHRLTLRASGDAVPCCTVWGQQLPMGNIKTQSLSEIWNSPAMKDMRKLQKEGRYHENPVCKQCAETSVA